MQCVEEDMNLVKLCGNDAQDCVDWRIGIKKQGKTDVKTMRMMIMKMMK